MTTYKGYAIHDTSKYSEAKLLEFTPRKFGSKDVEIKVDHCGICGSDVHTVTNGWGGTKLPVIPGHEVIGSVTKVGPEVSMFKVGDRVGVGAQIDACFKCKACEIGEETYCEQMVDAYNSEVDGEIVYGGYANYVTANEYFTFHIPKEIDGPEFAPLFCAGITVFAPLKRAITKPGTKVGIVGIGGLGHLGIQFAKALGAEVYAMSRGTAKKEDAFKLGADHYIDTTVKGWSKDLKYEIDLILSCANSNKNFDGSAYFESLSVHGSYISVGLPEEPFELKAQDFNGNGSAFGSSHLGNRSEMIEMLNICAEKGVKPWSEMLPVSAEGVKAGLEKTYNNKMRYRVTLTDYDKAFA